jgi:hypothetical protein
MSKYKAIALTQTMLTYEMSTKVEESDYIYYKVEDGIRPSKEVALFQPSEDDLVFNSGTKDWQRLIFPECSEYYEYEEDIYEQFLDYVEDNQIVLPSLVDKSMTMRFLQANHYKVKKASEDLLSHLDWRVNTLPILLTTAQKQFLDEGMFYIHGRDRNFRPLNVFDPRVVVGKNADKEEILMIVHFVLQYIIDNMLMPGKVENWVGLMDLSNLSLSKIPKKWLGGFIKSCQSNYKCRGVKSFVLNSSWGVRMIWKMVSPFVDSNVKKKIIFHDSNKCQELIDLFHPSQLEKKFGGKARNLDIYWPPQEVSKEYGVDPDKIKKPAYDDSADVDLSGEDDSVFDEENHISPIDKNLLFQNKPNPNLEKPIKVEHINIEPISQCIEGKFTSII